jgi:O-acetyl-ADP-ribose deacetylase
MSETLEKHFSNGKLLKLMVGNIVRVPADAIVNAANSALQGGGGVDGAIHRAGGPVIMQELDKIRARSGGCAAGKAVVTSAGKLPAQFVFHTVGPFYSGGRKGEAELLASCYRTCLELAAEHKIASISFPSISTGAYRYPIDEAAPVAMREVVGYLERGYSTLSEVVFVLFSDEDFDIYRKQLP